MLSPEPIHPSSPDALPEEPQRTPVPTTKVAWLRSAALRQQTPYPERRRKSRIDPRLFGAEPDAVHWSWPFGPVEIAV